MPGPLIVSQDTTASAESVWSILTDLSGSAEVMSGIQFVERLDAGTDFGVGTRWRETRAMFGKTATEEMAVTSIEPGTSYTVEADNHGVHYTSVLSVEPTTTGSTLTMHFAAVARGLLNKTLGAAVGRLFEGQTRKHLAQDLADICAAAERVEPQA